MIVGVWDMIQTMKSSLQQQVAKLDEVYRKVKERYSERWGSRNTLGWQLLIEVWFNSEQLDNPQHYDLAETKGHPFTTF